MGDGSKETELDIVNKYSINADVIKIGHHGSKTSSDEYFIKKINPIYSIISVGKNNRYGHPNIETLNSIKNTKVFRTDMDGTISFKINRNVLDVETYAP